MGEENPAVEQTVRDLLSLAIRLGLVEEFGDPQSFSSGDLVELANLLSDRMKAMGPLL